MLQPQNLVSDKRPLFSIFIITINVVVGLVIGQFIGLAVAMGFYEGDLLRDMLNPMAGKDLFYPLLIMQGIVSLIGFVVMPIFYIKTIEHRPITIFFKKEARLLLLFFIIMILGFNFIIALSPVTEWNAALTFPDFLKPFEEWARRTEDQNAQLTKVMTTFTSPGDLILCLVVVAILPAIGEELVFRGLLQNELWRGSKNIHVSIWTTAIIFSAIHIQFFGFFPRLFLGALFGYLYYWSGNLIIPMLAHLFNNGLSVIAVYLYNRGTITTDLEKTESAPWTAVLVSAGVVGSLLYYLWKFFAQQRTIEANEVSSPL